MKEYNQEWIVVTDPESGLQASFPREPFTMAFDIPFRNTPAYGKIRFYTMPVENGALILSIFHYAEGSLLSVEKNQLRRFFEETVIPHLFFQPSIFKNEQKYVHTLKVEAGEITAYYEFGYVENGVRKKLEGIAQNREGFLSTSFYVGDEEASNEATVSRFLNSVQ